MGQKVVNDYINYETTDYQSIIYELTFDSHMINIPLLTVNLRDFCQGSI